jgi:hypothetical protein
MSRRAGKLRPSALVAQGIEHGSPKAGVAGSNPAGGTLSCLGTSLTGVPRHGLHREPVFRRVSAFEAAWLVVAGRSAGVEDCVDLSGNVALKAADDLTFSESFIGSAFDVARVGSWWRHLFGCLETRYAHVPEPDTAVHFCQCMTSGKIRPPCPLQTQRRNRLHLG